MEMIRVVGSNPHGFKNEALLAYAINKKKISQLPTNLKKFVEYICYHENIQIKENEVVFSEKVKGQVKEDIFIKINNHRVGVSVKMGSGNSVHQEKIESFINWANSNTDITNQEKDDLRLMVWADGTTDGSAPIIKDEKGFVIGRFGVKDFISKYPLSFERLNNFFIRNKKAIILRALFDGKGAGPAEYLYKGTLTSGIWISKQEYIKHFIEVDTTPSTTRPLCGNLSYQAYNSSLKATESGEKKRGDIQFKYGDMANDLEKYEAKINIPANYGTREGDIEELNLSKIMNKNQNFPLWSYLKERLDFSDSTFHYLVKVDGKKYSQNAQKKVSCKSDNYVIETDSEIDRNLLLQNEYQLSENLLEKIGQYRLIPGSGISVKRRNSSSYTITKMSITNFKSAFLPYLKDIDYFIAAIIFYSTERQVHLNKNIAQDLNMNENNFIKFFSENFHAQIKNLYDYEALSEITTISKQIIKETIEKNKTLKANIFSGKGWFVDPYYINFVFVNSSFSDDVYIPYHIDNGSGRSKGKYYITFKPQ
ncbi:hypothetical protein RH915_07115 [Serpentinicella sp. ANB-PHB4]|uniref:hypothetical protein n=1 Tax=Serpentinicella sp. ANB-PHB4 TaxID=3074076 RepID=UPI00285E5C9A|nr:hypothetical protein [Serpentinicella sp. ANB-PHB4]MDR5659255.1 hypothetical protein [Serpentinicella sp. ANB-PHB4]